MLWTLQWYIFRELGKTFVLTAIALTVILGMGGGVLNMIEMQQVTVGQLLRIMTIVLPLAGTLALPIAALFSAAVVYGRLSADNEFVACSSSGINVHSLFAPTVLISLVSALFTFVAINYLIPGRIRNLDQFIRADLTRMVLQQLHAPGRLPLAKDKYRIYGERGQAINDPNMPADSEALRVEKVAFVEMDAGNWARYGTAESVRIRFDHLDTEPTVQVAFMGLSVFDRQNGRSYESALDEAKAERIRRRFPLKVKWLNLGELFHYRRYPGELPEVRDKLIGVRGVLAKERFYQLLARDFGELDATGQPDCELTLGDDQAKYTLRAESMTPDLYDFKPTFANVELVEQVGDKVRRATAESGTIDLSTRSGADYGKAYVELFGNVLVRDEDEPGGRSRATGCVSCPSPFRTS